MATSPAPVTKSSALHPHVCYQSVKGLTSRPEWLDVRLWTFSQRLNDKKHIGGPRPLMCNAQFLLKRSHLDRNPRSWLRVVKPGPLTAMVLDDDYDYADEDSDLDEESVHGDDLENEAEADDIGKREAVQPDKSSKKCSGDEIASGPMIGSGDEVNKQDTTSDSVPEVIRATTSAQSEPEGVAEQKREQYCQQLERAYEISGIKEILITDAASVTFQALLLYLLTGKIYLRKFFRVDNPEEWQEDMKRTLDRWEEPEILPVCSLKSAYRLAEKYDYRGLKKQALQGIQEALTPLNILCEYFSPFTAKYREVQEAELEYLLGHFAHPEVVLLWPMTFAKISEGLHAHAVERMSDLMERLTPLGPAIAPKRPSEIQDDHNVKRRAVGSGSRPVQGI